MTSSTFNLYHLITMGISALVILMTIVKSTDLAKLLAPFVLLLLSAIFAISAIIAPQGSSLVLSTMTVVWLILAGLETQV